MLRAEKKSPSSSAAAAAAAMGGRTARVCESCLCKRARWFCAADDAFLCQSCDVSVHSANQLARRHDRIRLETASFKSSADKSQSQSHLPPWLKGFTRKARTPRPNNNKQISRTKISVFSLVPEIGNENEDEEHIQFLSHHQEVPVFDPFDHENLLLTDELEDFGDGFLPSEVDLAEFVADVENLLGSTTTNQEHQEDEELNDENDGLLNNVKDEELVLEDCFNIHNKILDWDFKAEEFEDQQCKSMPMVEINEEEEELKKKKKKTNILLLRLNYDAVIAAWDSQSSPYTTGNRPKFDFDDCWVQFLPINFSFLFISKIKISYVA